MSKSDKPSHWRSWDFHRRQWTIEFNTLKLLAEEHGLDPESSLEDFQKLESLVAEATKERKERKQAGIDPKTGLSWFQSNQREDALRKRRDNKLAGEIIAETWMEVAEYQLAWSTGMQILETLPERLKSQCGLTDAAAKLVQDQIDQMRRDVEAQVANALKKKSAELRASFAPRLD